jgi:hypothetical protein
MRVRLVLCPLDACGVSFLTTPSLPTAFAEVVRNRAEHQVQLEKAGAEAQASMSVKKQKINFKNKFKKNR